MQVSLSVFLGRQEAGDGGGGRWRSVGADWSLFLFHLFCGGRRRLLRLLFLDNRSLLLLPLDLGANGTNARGLSAWHRVDELRHGFEEVLELGRVEGVEEVLVFHELDHKVLVGLVVVGDEVVNALEEGSQCAAVVLLLEQKLFLRENLDQVDQTVAGFTAQPFGVGRQVGHNRDD